MSKYISVSHLQKILPQLPAITKQLSDAGWVGGDLFLAAAMTNKLTLQSAMVDVHIAGFVITFDDGRIVATRREPWNMATAVPTFLQKLVY